MNAKTIVLDFVYYTLVLGIIIISVIVVINPGYFQAFSALLKALAPLFFFLGLMMIKLRWLSKEFKKRREEGNTDIVLQLSFFDKFITEILVFLLPMALSAIVMFADRPYSIIDFIQASLAFLILYIWNRVLLSRRLS